jgi:zinc protease
VKSRISLVVLSLLAAVAAAASPVFDVEASPAADPNATRPGPSAPRPLSLPKVEKTRLGNGLRVEIVEDHRVPLVTLRLGLPAGASLDGKGEEGTAEAVAATLTDGIPGLSSGQIAEKVASLGASLDASASPDAATVSGSVLSENFPEFFALFSRVVLEPTFPQEEVAIYRDNAIQKLTLAHSQPGFLAQERLAAVLFGEHPYAHIAATQPSLKSLTRERLEKFYRAHYTPDAAVLVLYGDVTASSARELTERTLAAWKGSSPAATALPAPPSRSGRTVALVDRPGSVQARIVIGTLAPTEKDPVYFPLTVANNIFGGGSGSRLFLDIREKRGYTYDPNSSYSTRKQFGTFVADCTARNEVAIPAIGVFFDLFDSTAKDPPSAEELDHSKAFLNGLFALRLATQGGVANQLLRVELFSLPGDWLEKYRSRIAAVTPAEAASATKTYVDSKAPVVVVVGDSKLLREGLGKYGPVEVYDSEGHRMAEPGK